MPEKERAAKLDRFLTGHFAPDATERAAIVAAVIAASTAGVVGLHAPAAGEDAADPSTLSETARRGAELAESVGECGTCHSAGEIEFAYGGARVDDWYAPALSASTDAPLPWTAAELFVFLRTGASPLHGVAVGPMSELIRGDLAALADEDIAALAAYFAEINGAPESIPTEEIAAAMEPAFDFVPTNAQSRGEWLYIGYCVSCHFNRPEAQTAKRPEIALNTAVSAPDPTTLVRVMLRGVAEPGGSERTVPGVGAPLPGTHGQRFEPQ